ncbi:hypothetical protein BLNAU_2044 [Blattamonas nauphoetae]|uniref:Uncharacterized protein n=1 Tax=Blattamonas nauphoetae TaxID=2049346 RepID=A0ABQ9YH83_9EUKA|nr:hypothetical protein BLNAU_2044 [Blattamonas nauphoetae]
MAVLIMSENGESWGDRKEKEVVWTNRKCSVAVQNWKEKRRAHCNLVDGDGRGKEDDCSELGGSVGEAGETSGLLVAGEGAYADGGREAGA